MVIRNEAQRWLVDHGAADLTHPGGTLLDHLNRVADKLTNWDASGVTILAGLCHAAYGTDGFDTALIEPTRRQELQQVIGTDAERIVYLYGSCQRSSIYPQLPAAEAAIFVDRFTGDKHQAAMTETRAFVEITAANEIDVMAHNDELAARYAEQLYQLFGAARHWLSEPAWTACATLSRST